MVNPEVVSLAGHEFDADVMGTISAAVGSPSPAKLDVVMTSYRSNAAWHLFGIRAVSLGGDLQSIIGIEQLRPGEFRIRHIATNTNARLRGHGTLLMGHVRSVFEPEVLWAETHGGAVGFYLKCGFRCESLGEPYPGVERFRCTLEAGRCG